MAKLKANIIELIKKDYSFQGAIIAVVDKHPRTIENWLDSNSDSLTNYSVMQVIKDRTGLTDAEILEPQTAQA